jgi:hypothetical protein
MKMDPSEFAMEHHSGLQIDFVALRDIDANEEIFIDYGQEWEDAWREHVQQYNTKKPKHSDKYRVSYELQRDLDLEVRTYDEGEFGPDILTYCHESYRLMHGLEPSDVGSHKCRAVKRYQNEEGDMRYVVELYHKSEEEEYSHVVVSEVLFDIPRDVFHFEDVAYTRDHCQPSAIRHEMMIPDDMFPQAWMNLNQETSSS